MCLGIPAQIVELVDADGRIAKAEISGVRRNVSVALCPEARVDDWVLVHVGFALSRIDEARGARDARAARADGRGLRAGAPRELRRAQSRDGGTRALHHLRRRRGRGPRRRGRRRDRDSSSVEGSREQVGIELVAPVERGDVLLCHAGIALEKLE